MKFKTIFVLLFFAVAIIGIIAPISAVSGSVSDEDKVHTIESKKKTVSLKITWNANGGKIGSKKTTVTTVIKGNKLNKLSTSPKRSGYTFKGWYTKKTGGKKISVNTKPRKSVTLFAQWAKKSSTNIDSKLLGQWRVIGYQVGGYNVENQFFFLKAGTFVYDAGSYKTIGNYKTSKGKISFSKVVTRYSDGLEKKYPNTVAEYEITLDSKKIPNLGIAVLDYPDRNYLGKNLWYYWYKYDR